MTKIAVVCRTDYAYDVDVMFVTYPVGETILPCRMSIQAYCL
jgi:hypothetical protein